MPKHALTDAYLRKIKPADRRQEITDAVAPGLRARISVTGQISFLLKSRDAAGILQTVTLGHYPEISLKEARDAALRVRLELKAGQDVNARKRAARKAAREHSETPTLRELLREYEGVFGRRKKVWAPSGPKTTRTQAGRVVERVFDALLDTRVDQISEDDLARSITSYRRVSAADPRATANGQVAKARLYLGPVLDWAAGRKSYSKIGAARSPKLDVPSMSNTHDPSADDPTITGSRERVLREEELRSLLPLLRYPAPPLGKLKIEPRLDYRPIAMRFILYTASRLEEVCDMRWGDIDRRNGVLHKPRVKSTKGGQRSQDLPLSEAAMSILRALPGWTTGKATDLVFPNSTGKGKLGNWTRFQLALNETSGTTGWHRHDLRRSAATLMHNLKIPASTIGTILAQTQPLRSENVSAAASHYLKITQIMTNARDPQEEALSQLAEALALIEFGEVNDAPAKGDETLLLGNT